MPLVAKTFGQHAGCHAEAGGNFGQWPVPLTRGVLLGGPPAWQLARFGYGVFRPCYVEADVRP